MKKIITIIIFTFFANAVLLINISHAQIKPGTTGSQANFLNETAGFTPGTTVGTVMATVIKAFLGMLGIILIVLIIMAGFNWMTSAGEEEKVNKAKKTIQRAVIGLFIILAAYSITFFVFSALDGVVGSGATTAVPI